MKFTDEQRLALKFAINTMDNNFSRNCMKYYRKGDLKVSYGQAINILEDMLTEVEEEDIY